MSRKIERVAVLGAGVMGSQIAAHFANAGIPSLLLDIVPQELTPEESAKGLTLSDRRVRNRIAQAGLDMALKLKPAAFFAPELAQLITVGNIEDDLSRLAECDWIIEAIIENLEIKRDLLKRIDRVRKPGTLISSNTSGISIRAMAEGLSDDFRRHWLGTHFFNPPRYLKLLEVIPAAETSPEVIEFVSDFCDRVLGKGVVVCKDTPNFIANRIGSFAVAIVGKTMIEGDYSIEEVDAMTGPAIGRPKSATFRTADIVGIDTAVHVTRNLYASVPNDERRDLFVVPDFMQEMVNRRWLGDKTGQGFYKKIKDGDDKEILALDYKTMEYRPRQRVKIPSLETAKNIDDVRKRIHDLAYAKDRAGQFIWKILSETLLYAANRIPEIADDIVSIDNAMKWGYNWELGPFGIWDAIGVEKSVARMREDGLQIPANVQRMLEGGNRTFYKKEDGRRLFFDFAANDYREIEENAGIIILSALKDRNRVIKKNAGASLIDLGDGVACLEFHSKMNAIGADTVQMMNFAIKEVSENFLGLVIGNQGENFSVGANLMLLLLEAQEENWDEIDLAVRAFQNANMQLRYSPKPVVAAPFRLSLGGGCEIPLHADRVRAAAELYIGAVETGVGLIPAGGGTKEFLIRCLDGAQGSKDVDLFPFVKRAFETIAMAKVSTSALDARKLGFLRPTDGITMNGDRLIEDAKQTVLAMAREGYTQPRPRTDIPALGQSALAALKLGIHMMKRAGYISEYDAHIGRKLAYVLTGGDLTHLTYVSEQYLLDLEREAFLSLCGERKTQERIQHTLKTGKPLRN